MDNINLVGVAVACYGLGYLMGKSGLRKPAVISFISGTGIFGYLSLIIAGVNWLGS